MSLSIHTSYTRMDRRVNRGTNRNLREPYTRVDNRAMNIPSTVSTRLDEAMTNCGYSQSSLARASGVPQPTINRILKGPNKRGPETETLRKLARACNVSFEWLNEGAESRSRIGSSKAQEVIVATPVQAVQESWLQRVNADEAELLELYRSLSKAKQTAAKGYLKIAAGKTAGTVASTAGADQAEHGAKRK
jgi:transcriptional regulator with XRE-family HTH domain